MGPPPYQPPRSGNLTLRGTLNLTIAATLTALSITETGPLNGHRGDSAAPASAAPASAAPASAAPAGIPCAAPPVVSGEAATNTPHSCVGSVCACPATPQPPV